MNNEDQCNPAAPEGQGDGAAGAAGGAGLSPLGEAALEYAACGIPVFPCVPGGKVPVPGVDSEDATTASGRIEDWWSEYPDANIGACPADFDTVVLDARGVVDQDLLARLRGEETLVHRTPHEGEHFFFNRPDRFDDGLFASGINAHCTTGYVLLPPSVVDGRPYQVVRNCGRITSFPGWAMERLAVGARASASGRNEAHARQKAKNRFGGLSPSEGATLPPLTYWDEKKTLPRSNMGGCIGFLVGQFGSHKTGTAIMMALDAIQTRGARVLFIAAEDANGVAKTRLPAACKGRGLDLAELDSHWRTETETFDLLSETDRAALIEAYREFAPDLIFIDVLTRVVTADINAPETGMRVMQSVYALAAPFRATVVIAHHPGLSGTGRPMGSSLFTSLADFCLVAGHKDGVVSTKVEKMKNGPDGFTVQYKTELATFMDPMGLMIEAPTVRAMTAAEAEEHKAKRVPRPDVAAENATDAAAIAKLERDAPDVLRALRSITMPMLLREIAPMLDATADDADSKDEEKGTPLASRIRRLNRLIGDTKSPGVLAPFTAPRAGGRTAPHRLIPIGTSAGEDQLPPENEPSDAPAS